MRINGITTHTREEYGLVTHVDLRQAERVIAETSCGTDSAEVERTILNLKCAHLHVPVPKEDDG